MLTYLSRSTPLQLLDFYIYLDGKTYEAYMGRDAVQKTNVLKKTAPRNKAQQ